jgi:hypothetical protein
MEHEMSVTLSTFEDALSFIADAQHKEILESVKFTGALTELKILVDGEKYKCSMTGELARGIWEYQEAIYKAASQVLYGVDDIRKLTSEQREEFNLNFKITEGSIEFKALIEKFIEKIGEGFTTMDDKSKIITMVLLAVVLSVGYGSTRVLEASEETKREEIKAELQISNEEEKTRQLQIFAKALTDNTNALRFSQATEDGTRAIMRSAPDASKISIGRINFDSQEINEVNQRAKKVKSTSEIVQEEFKVFGAETRHGSSTKYVLARPNGQEFPITVNHDDYAADDLNKLWNAAKNRTLIKLEVNLTMLKGSIRVAQISQFL